jgi:lysozyme family protein
MIENFEASFDHLIKSEGGYVFDKDDAGGETNFGVTKQAWSEYLKRPIEDGEMKALTVDAVKPFYKKMYWDKLCCDDLPNGVDYAVFDFGVNAGIGRSARFLQRAVNAVPDGAIGAGTLARVRSMKGEMILESFGEQKNAFYISIAQTNPTQTKFLKGWLNRVASVQTISESMMA